MEDVRKWMESRLGSVPGLLAIIVTDRQIIVHNFSNLCISFSNELLCSREGVPVVRASTAECPETAVRSPALFPAQNDGTLVNCCSVTFSGPLFWVGVSTEAWQSRRASWV